MIRVALSVLEERETVIYIRAPLVVFRVCNICSQRTVPPILESLRSCQGLMMQLIHCLLKCAVAHS